LKTQIKNIAEGSSKNKKFAATKALLVVLAIFMGISLHPIASWAAANSINVRSILKNKEFFSQSQGRRNPLSDYENHRIYDINTQLGENRLGIVFIDLNGIQETVVFDKNNGKVIYKKVNILKKNARLSMLKESIPVTDACRLAATTRLSIGEQPAELRSTQSHGKNLDTPKSGAKKKVKKNTAPANKKIRDTRDLNVESMNAAEIFDEIKRETGWASKREREQREHSEKPARSEIIKTGMPEKTETKDTNAKVANKKIRDTRNLNVESMSAAEIFDEIKRETGWASKRERERRERSEKPTRSEIIKTGIPEKTETKDTNAKVANKKIRDTRNLNVESMNAAEIFDEIKRETGWISKLERERRKSERLEKFADEINHDSEEKKIKDVILAQSDNLDQLHSSERGEISVRVAVAGSSFGEKGPYLEGFTNPEISRNPANSGLIQKIVSNRDFFARLGKRRNFLKDENYRIYDVDSQIGEDYIAIVFLASDETLEFVVFDENTAAALYKNTKRISNKEVYPAMLKNSLGIADACFLAENIAFIQDQNSRETVFQGLQEDSGRFEQIESENTVKNTDTAGHANDFTRFKRETGWVTRTVHRQKNRGTKSEKNIDTGKEAM
jgi:hypothetical protein